MFIHDAEPVLDVETSDVLRRQELFDAANATTTAIVGTKKVALDLQSAGSFEFWFRRKGFDENQYQADKYTRGCLRSSSTATATFFHGQCHHSHC